MYNADATLSNGTLATCDFRRIYIILFWDLIYKVWGEGESENMGTFPKFYHVINYDGLFRPKHINVNLLMSVKEPPSDGWICVATLYHKEKDLQSVLGKYLVSIKNIGTNVQ